MPRQAMSYRARVAAQVHAAYPLFPSVIMELILKLAMGKMNYDVSSRNPVQMADFDFLYTKRKSATSEISLRGNGRVFGTACGEDFPIERPKFQYRDSGFFTGSKPSLVGKNGRAVIDLKIRNSREILADQIKLDHEIHSTIVSEIERLVKVLGHTNKVQVKLHKLLIHCDSNTTEEYTDKWPKSKAKEIGAFTALVPISGSGHVTIGSRIVSDIGHSAVIVFDPREVEFGVMSFISTYLVLVFQVFDTGVLDPDAHVIGPSEAFSKAIARGFNKVAVQSIEDYGERNRVPKLRELRGTDKVFADHAQASGAKKIEVCEVCRDKEGRIFRPQVIHTLESPVRPRPFSFPKSHKEESEEEEEEEEEEEVQEQTHNTNSASNSREEAETKLRNSLKRVRTLLEHGKKDDEDERLLIKRVKFIDKFDVSPRFDEFNERDVVKDEYRLGDTLFLASSASSAWAFLHTGNYNSALAIIAHF